MGNEEIAKGMRRGDEEWMGECERSRDMEENGERKDGGTRA